jgi:hypothetical protein
VCIRTHTHLYVSVFVCVSVCVCVHVRSTKAPAVTRAHIETSKIVSNNYHGLVASGGGAAVLIGVDICKNARAGMYAHRQTHTHIHIRTYVRTYVHT